MTRGRPKKQWWHQQDRAAMAQRRALGGGVGRQAGGSTQECSRIAIALQKGG